MSSKAGPVPNNNGSLTGDSELDSKTSKQTGVLFETDADTADGALNIDVISRKKAENRKLELVWRNISLFAGLHLLSVYGAYLFFFEAKWATILFSILMYSISILGISASAHRCFAHRAYKAKWPLRLILIFVNTCCFQDSVYHWSRDHRVHHKYSETDADPHNATRGFFFSHIGWLLCKKHPDVIAKGKAIDLSDLRADPIVMFQHKYYMILMPLGCFVMPTVVPMYFWNESLLISFLVPTLFRWCVSLNVIWCVNSAAHKYGGRPYDKSINPSQNAGVSTLAFGEGWHNYHHVFPWDYKTNEWGYYPTNLTTAFIDFFAKIGWAYELKSVSPEMIKKRVKRTGDGTHEIWGYGDKDLANSDVLVLNKKSE